MTETTIEGTWVVRSYRSGDGLVTPSDQGPRPTLAIVGKTVSGSMGVNRLTCQITEDGRFGPVATTRMAGSVELMAQEDTLLGHLAGADSIEVRGEGMTLSRDGLNLVELERSGTGATDRSS
jgi:heat shock protein HslJ